MQQQQAQFTISLPAKAVGRLQALAQQYNQNTGQNLTAAQWLELHVKELLVAEELAAEAQRLEREAQEKLQADVQAARQRLIAAL